MMSLLGIYNNLPSEMHETLIRSHIRFEKGWNGITLEDYLKLQETDGNLPVMREICQRCFGTRIWDHIDCIIGGWTYEKGKQISQGFNFTCNNPDALLTLLKSLKDKFCQDSSNCHGPRDTFRELIKAGPGLHVCVTQEEKRNSNLHDIHIDKFQLVCNRQNDGFCDYTYIDKQFYDHMKDVVPWWVSDKLKEVGKVIAEHPPERGPKY